ncbi:MAG: T3SS effector HopA1 family protein [Actinomycetota bacterium]|nr:T3SS effector HopA1 family protein [Actinomycetota bacterium]
MSEYRRQLENAVGAIAIHSATSYSWMGERSPRLPPNVRLALTPTAARAYLRFALQTRLYHSFYRLGRVAPNDGRKPKRSLDGRTPFVDSLSAANLGRGFVEDGWVVREIRGATAIVEKHGLALWVPVDDCVVPAGTRITAGEPVGLPHSKELPAYSPGFYSAFGDRSFPASNTTRVVRLYWNLTQEGAVPFVEVVSERLNHARLPFRFKVLSDPDNYERCDAAVIYLPVETYQEAAPIIERIHTHVASLLRTVTPVFTKPLSPGLGLAEDPPGGHSFGMHRCGLVADGLITAFSEAASSLPERAELAIRRFAEAGIDIESPFLNPGSTDSYVVFGSETQGLDGRQVRSRAHGESALLGDLPNA